ncbi:PREDICTED: protein SZT2-like [Priapulus caudatus]|uniref:Protein SZT2-like n=1 Tax=Priapulus caudatus TaxID=37621 RepID=A0ABM1E8F2_PRICU|nr:PREDICTED: protein SZT2-like [Priapulus caudatus]
MPERSGEKLLLQLPGRVSATVVRVQSQLLTTNDEYVDSHMMEMTAILVPDSSLLVSRGVAELEKVTRLGNLYRMWQQRTSHSHVAITLDELALLKQSSRLVHFCATPLLFSPAWRRSADKHKMPNSLPRRSSSSGNFQKQSSDDSNSRSRQSSGGSAKLPGGLQRRGDAGGAAAGTDARRSLRLDLADALQQQQQRGGSSGGGGGEEMWHVQLRQSFMQEFIQYMTSLGYVVVRTRPLSPKGKRPATDGSTGGGGSGGGGSRGVKLHDAISCYLQKTMLGGILMVELKYVEPFFMISIFGLECSRLLTGTMLSNQMKLMFIDECEKDKIRIHVHSFAYDFHLRTILSYLSGRVLILKQGYHLASFMNDFMNYYQKSPGFARNDCLSGTISIPDLITPASKLYEYMLNKDRHYGMTVMRMVPVTTADEPDPEVSENEYVLVSLSSCRGSYKDLEDARQLHEFDVGLIVEHSAAPCTAVRQTDGGRHTLSLQYFIVMASRRELFPKITLEKFVGSGSAPGKPLGKVV